MEQSWFWSQAEVVTMECLTPSIRDVSGYVSHNEAPKPCMSVVSVRRWRSGNVSDGQPEELLHGPEETGQEEAAEGHPPADQPLPRPLL